MNTVPSIQADPRERAVRSPHCPNDIHTDDTGEGERSGAGKCGSCAWGFYTFASPEPQLGECVVGLNLRHAILPDGTRAGYRSQCGLVELYYDQWGRLGAVRIVNGEKRFFPGLEGNFAFERYKRQNPKLRAEEADARAA